VRLLLPAAQCYGCLCVLLPLLLCCSRLGLPVSLARCRHDARSHALAVAGSPRSKMALL
jgi:hypothetical protein